MRDYTLKVDKGCGAGFEGVVGTKEKSINCKGLIYRYTLNPYINSNNDYVVTRRLRLMKRMSCKGCEKCYWLLDQLKEDIASNCPPPIPDNLISNELCQLKVVDHSIDYWSGHCDDVEIGFVEFKEQEK